MKVDFITFHAHLIWKILTFIKGDVDCDIKRLPFSERKNIKMVFQEKLWLDQKAFLHQEICIIKNDSTLMHQNPLGSKL